MFLVLAALAMTIFAGCGGSGGSPQTSEKQQEMPSAERRASGTANSAEQKPENIEAAKRAQEDNQGDKLEHPYLGSADAPVVLTEYSDYQ